MGLPAQKEIFPDYFPPLAAEEMTFLHQSGLVSNSHIAASGAEVKILCQAKGNEASQCPKQGAGEIPYPYLLSLLLVQCPHGFVLSSTMKSHW